MKWIHLFLLLLSFLPIRSQEFDLELTTFALEFAASAYAPDPLKCLGKNNATLVLRLTDPCDILSNQCWVNVAFTDDWIVVAFRGTKTKLQLIVELVESMSEPKKKLRIGGAVQHYFYDAFHYIRTNIFMTVKKLKDTYPNKKILFTGHSLGGALASLASTIYAQRHAKQAESVHLITFGQPRVGNYDYAMLHDKLVPNSWRIVHKHDMVAHMPACESSFFPPWSCHSLSNHSPYHHGKEIWFPDGMRNNSLFMMCDGTPIDEDSSCSNGWSFYYSIRDHINYFEHHVSDYGINGCEDPQGPLSPNEAQFSLTP